MERATTKNTESQQTPEEDIDSLKERVETLEGQVLNCLKFMRYQAEKEADRLNPNWRKRTPKAKA